MLDLGKIIFADRPEMDDGFEPRLRKQRRQIFAELGEDRISPVAAGVANARGAILDRPVRKDDRPRKGFLNRRKNGNGEDVPAARGQHTVDFTKSGIQVGHVLECLRSQNEVQGVIGIG